MILKINKFPLPAFILLALSLSSCVSSVKSTVKTMPAPAQSVKPVPAAVPVSKKDDYREYLAFFEKVYKTMDQNYYESVRREDFNRFLETFNTKIYAQLKGEHKSDDFIRWRSAAYLVDYLKTKEDIFSAFYPPKPAKQYAQEALGERIDLGIDGEKVDAGFRVKHVEPRSDAYGLGLREGDILTAIGDAVLQPLASKDIEEKLTPLKGTKVKIAYVDHEKFQPHEIEPESKEYFKQTVFLKDVPVPGIFCLEIPKLNRMTSEDLLRFLIFTKEQNAKGLILDFRGNPGGPPLAAREISSFFLKAGDLFAYFQKKGQDKAELDVPAIPEQYKFDGPIVILVNKDSGSAAELFSGVMQFKGRAILMGENTAGQVMLKSMFDFDDKSMLLLITSRGHYPDGRTFSFNGLDPDNRVTPDYEPDLVKIAAIFLFKVAAGEVQWPLKSM
jgi:carboxyl-terminal processing protease